MSSFLKSMTAYGRGTSNFSYGRFTVEIQSVNRRYLDVNVAMPRLLMRFEMDVRKKIAERVGRGMVNVSLSWKSDAKQPVNVIPNLALAKGVKNAWELIANELGMEGNIPLSLLANEKDLFLYEEELIEEELYRTALDEALSSALEALIVMKVKEGKILTEELKKRVETLTEEIAHIEGFAGEASEKYRQKLSDRLETLFTGHPDNEEKILREVAVFAERVDITEEVVRFKSHLEQSRQLLIQPLKVETETRGKKLDFLIQELNREINTIGVKSSDLHITTQHVVNIKSEIEKMREQVQNIE